MSLFVCKKCGGYGDADDGCEPRGNGLICVDCLYAEEPVDEAAAPPEHDELDPGDRRGAFRND